MKVIICGGRDYKAYGAAFNKLDYIHSKINITTVIEGGAGGADHIAKLWAAMHLIRCMSVPAQWGLYGRSAGYRRNIRMADMHPDLIIAMPGGRGTRMMRDIGKKRNIKTILMEKVNVPESFRPPPNFSPEKEAEDRC